MVENEHVLDFLLFSYFELDVDMIEKITLEKVIKKCIRRAYLDFCRTIKFTTDEHASFVETVANSMNTEITKLLANANKIDFDKWHEETCVLVCDIAKKNKVRDFSYGQAQKWVNMTLKYMWFLEIDKANMSRK